MKKPRKPTVFKVADAQNILNALAEAGSQDLLRKEIEDKDKRIEELEKRLAAFDVARDA